MPRGQKTTTETFIVQAREIHEEEYDHSKVVYINGKTPVIIICRACGLEFLQKPCIHLQGSGCPDCWNKRRGDAMRHTLEQFIEKSVKIHRDKCGYSLVNYINSYTNVKIICNSCHRVFEQTPQGHLKGNGCPDCSEAKRAASRILSLDVIIVRGREIHGQKYDYSMVVYIGIMSPVILRCNDCGHKFPITMNSHLNHRAGCKVCARKEKITRDVLITKSKKLHGDNHYNYGKIPDLLPNNNSKIILICNICNFEFPQKIRNHLAGHGCIKCACREPLTRETFIEKSCRGHPSDEFDYSQIPDNPRFIDYVTLVHKKCGKEFSQSVAGHIHGGYGCPTCRKSRSEKACRRIFQELMHQEFPSKAKLSWLQGLDLDGFCEAISLAFEYQGIQHVKVAPWFGMGEKELKAQQERDQRKRELCRKHNVTLIEVPHIYSYKNEQKMREFIMKELTDREYILIIQPNLKAE